MIIIVLGHIFKTKITIKRESRDRCTSILSFSTCFTGSRLHLTTGTPSAVMTGGLVQEFHHVVLPSVPPVVTLLATVTSILVGTEE